MAGCGYVCPVCGGTGITDDGSTCDWCQIKTPPVSPLQSPPANFSQPVKSPENPPLEPDAQHLKKLANTKMPFGKHAGSYLVDLPETYVLWFKQKGFPKGELGLLLAEICEIQANGLENLIREFIER